MSKAAPNHLYMQPKLIISICSFFVSFFNVNVFLIFYLFEKIE